MLALRFSRHASDNEVSYEILDRYARCQTAFSVVCRADFEARINRVVQNDIDELV